MYGARTPRMFQLVFVVDNETGGDFSRAPVFSCTHYFQAPATQANFILPLELICSPLLLAYLLTGGFLLKHKFYQFLVLCLDHRYCPGAN